MSTLYFAYGANTNLAAMERRCPRAIPVAPALLRGWKLVFKGVADIVEQPGAEVFGALWRITEEDEKSLDRFEGFPMLYVKRYVRLTLRGKAHWCMFYVMRDREWSAAPGKFYEQTLREGYRDFGLPSLQLDDAIRHAHRAEMKRWKRLAQEPLFPLDRSSEEA